MLICEQITLERRDKSIGSSLKYFYVFPFCRFSKIAHEFFHRLSAIAKQNPVRP
jgi:hypothetical protein